MNKFHSNFFTLRFRKLKRKRNLVALIKVGFTILLLGGVFLLLKNSPYFAETLPTATINIDASKDTGEIPIEMFGAAAEPQSDAFFFPGYATAIKNAGIKLIRINGGTYLGQFGFTRALGTVDQRVDLARTIDSHVYPAGPDEWMKTAKTAGAKLMITMPYSHANKNADINQFANLVEYMNIPLTPELETIASQNGWQVNYSNPDQLHSWGAYDKAPKGYFAWLRKQANNGTDPGPYNADYWEIGNEVYGGMSSEAVSSANYVADAIDYAAAMKAVDPNIQIGAVITSNWTTSVWDQAGVNWEEVVTRKVIENAYQRASLNLQPSTLIDFLIPHYYGPYPNGKIPSAYRLYNPKEVTYSFSNGTVPPITVKDKKVSFVKSLTLDPGKYAFTISATGTCAPINNQNICPELEARLIDDGGIGSEEVSDKVTINSPGTEITGGKAIINDTSGKLPLPTFNFTSDGKQTSAKSIINLTNPSQKYRLELLFNNHSWQNAAQQDYALQKSGKELKKSTDFIAQSFVSQDNVFDSLLMSFERDPSISQADLSNIKLQVDLYPDSGGVPDMSSAPLATYERPSWDSLAYLQQSTDLGDGQIKFYNTLDAKYDDSVKTPVTQGSTYWLVAHLSSDLTGPGYVSARGNMEDSNVDGYTGSLIDSVKVKDESSSSWRPDTNLMDVYFYVHTEVDRVTDVQNFTITKLDDNNNPISSTIAGLGSQNWYTGIALSAYDPYDYSKAEGVPGGDLYKIKDFQKTVNSELKQNPAYANLADFYPATMATEFNYTYTGESLSITPSIREKRMYFPAIYDANQLFAFIKAGTEGAVIHSIGAANAIYRYQDPWSLFDLNTNKANSTPSQIDPNLYVYNPTYYMMKLLSENAGAKKLQINTTSPQFTYDINYANQMLPKVLSNNDQENSFPFNWKVSPNLLKLPKYQRPLLNAIASYKEAEKKLLVTVINSDSNRAISTDINLGNFTPNSKASVKTLNTSDEESGLMSVNGFSTVLDGNDQNQSWIKVQDISQFQPNDTIALQSTTQGQSHYYKIATLDTWQKKIYIKGLDDSDAKIPCVTPTSIFCSPANTYPDVVDVVRITGSVGISEKQISSVSENFNYIFPAHSITLIEISQNTGNATLPPEPSVTKTSTPKTSTITPTNSPTATQSNVPASSTEEITNDTSPTPASGTASSGSKASPSVSPVNSSSPSTAALTSPEPEESGEIFDTTPVPEETTRTFAEKIKGYFSSSSGSTKIAIIIIGLLIISLGLVFIFKRKVKIDKSGGGPGRDEVNIE